MSNKRNQDFVVDFCIIVSKVQISSCVGGNTCEKFAFSIDKQTL